MNLGWIDFSKEDRNKVLNVISLLKTKGAVDEIGIGVVRDAFANEFFPGTSTVQAGAKYFLIVPYVIKETIEEIICGKYGNDFNKIIKKIEEKERECGQILIKNCPNINNIIGSHAMRSGDWVERSPSSIYWSGIRTYGICKQKLTLNELIKVAIRLQGQRKTYELGNKGDKKEQRNCDDEDTMKDLSAQLFSLPNDYYGNWRENLTIDLTKSEAEFLKEKIIRNANDKLIGYILKNNIDLNEYQSFECLYETLKNDLPSEISTKMFHACEFNKLVYVAHVRYNYILSNGENQNAKEKWEEIKNNLEKMLSVNIDEVLRITRIHDIKLKSFLINFKNALLDGNFDKADKELKNREISIKGIGRSKLCKQEEYKDSKWIGGEYLDYRFPDAKRIIDDIYKGEKKDV